MTEKIRKAPVGHAMRKRELIIHAVMTCPTLTAAAKQCGISRSTVDKYIADLTFQRDLAHERERLARNLTDSLLTNANKGLATMIQMSQSPAVGDSAKAAVSIKLTELAIRAGTIEALQARIQQLEDQLREQNGSGIGETGISYSEDRTNLESESSPLSDSENDSEQDRIGSEQPDIEFLPSSPNESAQRTGWTRSFGNKLDGEKIKIDDIASAMPVIIR